VSIEVLSKKHSPNEQADQSEKTGDDGACESLATSSGLSGSLAIAHSTLRMHRISSRADPGTAAISPFKSD
jgi:hypothetical protein